METLGISFLLVAVGEIGDKTQLLALCLAARFRKPLPVAAGILAATLLNHLLAAWAGRFLSDLAQGEWVRWVIGLSFLGLAVWALRPDVLEHCEDEPDRGGAFLTTLVSFFLAEIGDKTQVATAGLGAAYPDLTMVVAGTTLGMLAADLPVIWLGGMAAGRIPFGLVRRIAAGLFALTGAAVLAGYA